MPDFHMEAGDKPFNANAMDASRAAAAQQQPTAPVLPPAPGMPSGEPGAQSGHPSASALAALGLPVPPPQNAAPAPVAPAQQPQSLAPFTFQQPAPAAPATPPPAAAPVTTSEQHGKQMVDTYSATIQRHAEEAYATVLVRAKQDPTVVDSLLASTDKVERDLGRKLIERNAELFGAGNVEEYQAKKQIDAAGDDPTAREIAQMKLNEAKREARERERDWKDWKRDHGIKDDAFGQLCDDIRKAYPALVESDIVSMARGRAGVPTAQVTHVDANAVLGAGARGAPGADQPGSNAAASALGVGAQEASAADAYFAQVGGVPRR